MDDSAWADMNVALLYRLPLAVDQDFPAAAHDDHDLVGYGVEVPADLRAFDGGADHDLGARAIVDDFAVNAFFGQLAFRVITGEIEQNAHVGGRIDQAFEFLWVQRHTALHALFRSDDGLGIHQGFIFIADQLQRLLVDGQTLPILLKAIS